MSEEEKEAIETLKEVASDDFDTLGDDISPKMARNILSVINKQRKDIEEKNIAINKMSKDISYQLKEIEELKEKNTQLTNYLNDSYYVSADEIREKIEKYEKDYERQDKEELFNLTKITAGKLSALKELLEDN